MFKFSVEGKNYGLLSVVSIVFVMVASFFRKVSHFCDSWTWRNFMTNEILSTCWRVERRQHVIMQEEMIVCVMPNEMIR